MAVIAVHLPVGAAGNCRMRECSAGEETVSAFVPPNVRSSSLSEVKKDSTLFLAGRALPFSTRGTTGNGPMVLLLPLAVCGAVGLCPSDLRLNAFRTESGLALALIRGASC